MYISFVCSSCSHKMKVPVSFAGKKVKCLQCTAMALVPQPEPARAAALERATPSNSPEGIVFTCPSCGTCFEVAVDLAGKPIRCRECEEWGRVPLAAGEDEAEEEGEEEEGLVATLEAPALSSEGSGSHTPQATEDERVFYRKHGVLVSNGRVVVGENSYPLAGISAAQKSWREHLEYRFRPVFAALCVVAVLGLAGLLLGALSAAGHQRSVGPWVVGLLLTTPVAVVCGILGGGWVRRRSHRLILVNAGIEVQALESDNAVLVADVLEAVNEALKYRK